MAHLTCDLKALVRIFQVSNFFFNAHSVLFLQENFSFQYFYSQRPIFSRKNSFISFQFSCAFTIEERSSQILLNKSFCKKIVSSSYFSLYLYFHLGLNQKYFGISVHQIFVYFEWSTHTLVFS